MNKAFLNIFSAFLLMSCLVSCGPTSEEAIVYNNKLVAQHTRIYEKEIALTEAISKNLPAKFDPLLAEMVKQIDSAIAVAKKMDAFDGKTDMKDAAMKVFSTYKEVAGSDYAELIKHAKVPDSTYTQADDDKVMELSKKIFEKLSKCEDDFFQVQKGFAEKYKFEPANIEAAEGEKERK